MRIAVNTRFLIKDKLEGIGRFTYEVLKKMVAAHPEDEFIFFFDRHYDAAFVFAKNVTPVVVFPPARHPFLFIWWYEFSVAQALKKYQPDVFLSTDNFCTLNTQIPTVLVVHDLSWIHFPQQVSKIQKWYYEKYVPRHIRKADRIVTVSEFTREDILTHFPVTENKIAVACNGSYSQMQALDEEQKQAVKNTWSAGADYFVYVGAIHPRKNVHRLLWAFQKFKEVTGSATKMVIVGRKAWMTREVQQAYKNATFQEDIIFTGYVADETLPNIIGAAQAMVYVSLFEGFGIPLLDAMHAEIPIITSNVSSMPEVAGGAAIYVNPLNVKEIAAAMERISEDEELRESLIASARQQRQKFTWQRAADVVYQSLQKAIGQD